MCGWMGVELVLQQMKGIIAILLLVHSCFSALRVRKYFQANELEPFLPQDIGVEMLVGITLAILSILKHASELKLIREFTQTTTYDAAFTRKNFKNYSSLRGDLLKQLVQANISDLSVSL